MAVSTPRRLIAEDASYGKISTPDGSRYESATAELGGMLTKEGADTIPTSEEMINILAADRLKLQTVSSQLFDLFDIKYISCMFCGSPAGRNHTNGRPPMIVSLRWS